jgi:hypothetical protein
MMRAGNLLAWAGLLALALGALLVANRLGFVGLTLLGLLTWLVCSQASLSDHAPTWSQAVFHARLQGSERPEPGTSPYRFYARCGMALTAAGLAGTACQFWLQQGPP